MAQQLATGAYVRSPHHNTSSSIATTCPRYTYIYQKLGMAQHNFGVHTVHANAYGVTAPFDHQPHLAGSHSNAFLHHGEPTN